MPGRFPDIEDIQLPGVAGPRPVASVDPSGYGRGLQAMAQGVQNLGQGIEKGAKDVAELEQYKLRNNALLAQDQIIGNVIKAREEFRHDTNYDDLTQRWDKRVDDIVQQGIQDVPEGPVRTHVTARLQIPLARSRDQVEEYAFTGRKQAAHADMFDRETNIMGATGPYEDPLTTAQVDAYNSRADEYGASGLMTPLEVQQHKQRLALKRADARARARIDMGPEEAAKVEQELRNSIPRGGGAGPAGAASRMYPAGGWSTTDHAASVTAEGETGDRTLGVKALGNISPDKNGSKSYGFMGLNSGSGSAAGFAFQYGRQFGITARPGSAAFDEQWKSAATDFTDPFRQAQLAYFNERVVPTIKADVQRYGGVPDAVANDPRVVTYFADRKIQMGIAGLGAARQAWANAGGDPVRFLRNMTDLDRANIESNFRTTLAERLYSPEGHETRLRTRLNGALAAGAPGAAPPAPPREDNDPATLMDRTRQQYPVLNNEDIQYKFSPGRSDNMLESWPPDEPGDESYKRPGEFPMGKFGVEVFDPKTRPIDILGDVVSHRLINTDPKIKQYYSDFVKSITPEQEARLHEQYDHAKEHEGEKRPYEQWKEMTGLPAYFRGYAFQQWPKEFTDKAYTPDQIKNLDAMMDYLRGGKPEGAAAPPPSEAPTGYAGDPLFQKLEPQHRDTLITRAREVQRQGRVAADQQLKAGIADDYAAASGAGYVGKGRGVDDFIDAYGDEKGRAAYEDYKHGLQLSMDTFHLRDMTPDERHALIESHMPNPAEPGYDERTKQMRPLIAETQRLDAEAQKSAVKEKQDEIKDLSKRVEDNEVEVRTTGKLQKAITREEFVRTLGPEEGEAAFNRYTSGVQYTSDLYHIAEQTPEDKIGTVQRYRPLPGQDNQKEAWARVGELREAADKLHKDLVKDPVTYMLQHNPSVRDAWTKMEQAPDDAKAAQAYADMTTAEQRRFGVDPDGVKVLPDAAVDAFKNRIETLAKDGNANMAMAFIKQEQQKWGPAWNEVYRQVAVGDPLMTVIGAGVQSQAGQALVANKSLKYNDIIKDEQSAKAKDIQEEVDKRLLDFKHSTMGSDDGAAVYDTVRGQVEKLAAIYAMQDGLDATKAAQQAADDVVNFKYVYQDGYRIPGPKDASPAQEPLADIRLGAATARAAIGTTHNGIDLTMKPAMDTTGVAYTPEQLAAETAARKREGHWATNGDESGLWFVYKGQVQKKPDGSYLELTWKQVADIGRTLRENSDIARGGWPQP